MPWYQIVSMLFGSGILLTAWRYLYGRVKTSEKKTEAVCLGVQALLRDRLIQSYNYHVDKGYAPIYAKENFENMWKQYHNLGVNGVMDGLHDNFMELPDRPPEVKNESDRRN